MNNRIAILTLFTILILVVIFLGCSANEYQQITKTIKGINFSFDCPISYQDQMYSDTNEYRVVFLRPDGENVSWDYSNVNTAFTILVYDPDEKYQDANSMLEDLIHNWSNAPSYHEYKLIERSEIMISGIKGELFVCSVKVSEPGTDALASRPSIIREVYLDYCNKIWEIDVDCYPELADQVEVEFKHIISSFRFLN